MADQGPGRDLVLTRSKAVSGMCVPFIGHKNTGGVLPVFLLNLFTTRNGKLFHGISFQALRQIMRYKLAHLI